MGIHEGNATKKPGQKENFALYDKESMLETICSSYSFLKKGKAISASLDDDDFSHMFYVFKDNFMSRPGYKTKINEGIPYVTSPFYSETEVEDKKVLDYYPLKLMIQNLIDIGDSCQYAEGFENIRIHEGYSVKELARQAYAKARNVLAFIDVNLGHFEVDVDHDDIIRLSEMLSKRMDHFDDYSNVLAEVARGMLSEKTIGDGFGFVTGVKRKDKESRGLVKGPMEYSTTVKAETPAGSAETSLVPTARSIPPKAISAVAAKVKPKVACTDPDDEIDYIRELSNLERDMLLKTIDFGQLRTRMKERVIGQDNAIDEIVDSYIMMSLGTSNPKKPKNFLAVGPTGVGKNYAFEVMAETVAEMLQISFPFRLLECGSFNSEASVNNLLGAQKGYINSEMDGVIYTFYKKARMAPFSMLLFDEYEKAHASLEKVLLPILDRGSLHDNKDHFIDLRSMFIGFTSNIGYSDQRGSCGSIGFFENKELADIEKRRYSAEITIKSKMSPEFLGRANIIHFEMLTRESIEKIFALEFGKIASRFSPYGLKVEYDDSAKAHLIDRGFSSEYGARNITNTIERNINNPLSLMVQRDLSYDIAEIMNALDYIRNTKAREISYESESSKRRVDAKQRNPRIEKEDLDALVPQEHIQIVGMKEDVFENIRFRLPYSRILVSYDGSALDFKRE